MATSPESVGSTTDVSCESTSGEASLSGTDESSSVDWDSIRNGAGCPNGDGAGDAIATQAGKANAIASTNPMIAHLWANCCSFDLRILLDGMKQPLVFDRRHGRRTIFFSCCRPFGIPHRDKLISGNSKVYGQPAKSDLFKLATGRFVTIADQSGRGDVALFVAI